jgi:hypothetical protein
MKNSVDVRGMISDRTQLRWRLATTNRGLQVIFIGLHKLGILPISITSNSTALEVLLHFINSFCEGVLSFLAIILVQVGDQVRFQFSGDVLVVDEGDSLSDNLCEEDDQEEDEVGGIFEGTYLHPGSHLYCCGLVGSAGNVVHLLVEKSYKR